MSGPSIRNAVWNSLEAYLRPKCADTHRVYAGLLLATLGIAFAVAGLTLWFVVVRPQTTRLNQAVLGIVVHVLFGYVVVMGGVVLARSELSVREWIVTTKWCLGGAAFMGGLVLWRALPRLRSGTAGLGLANELVVVSSVGAAAGVLVGLNRGRATRNRHLVSQKDDREETLVFLLRLLDHDIRNHLLAISEHADSIRPSTFDPSPTPSEAIENRAERIERLLETASVVLESETGDRDLERVNVTAVLVEAIAVVRSDAPDAEIDVDVDGELHAEADRFLGEVFRNLLDNAVVHNGTDGLTISVSATAAEGGIAVEIADDGRGLPEPVRENPFDPGVQDPESSGDGIGLYLVRKLVESYGGSVSVSDRTPSGTRFRIRLPRAPDGDESP
jgi:signal transduction histidine kinase